MAEVKSKNLKKAALYVTLLTLLSKLFGFFRETIVAYYYGTSTVVDAYLMAVSIPTILFGFLSCVAPAYTVVYAEIRERKGIRSETHYSTTLLGIVAAFSLLTISASLLIPEQLVGIVAPGYDETARMLTVQHFQIVVWDVLFISLLNIFAAYLKCNDRFAQTGIAMLFHSSVQILFTFLAGITQEIFLAYGYVLADACYLLMLYQMSRKAEFRFQLRQDAYSAVLPDLKETGRLVLPIFLSSTLTQINAYMDKSFASMLVEGSVSALYYANIVRTFVIMMLNTGITTVLYPTLSKFTARGERGEANDTFGQSARYILILFIPASVGLICVSEQVISVLFGRGAFNADSVRNTALALTMYTVGILAVGMRDILTNYLYALKKMKACLWISVAGIGMNIAFNFLLVGLLGHAGLALGTSLSAIFTIPMFFYVLKKETGYGFKKSEGILTGKILLAAAAMTAVILPLKNMLELGDLWTVLVVAGVGALVYGVVLFVLKAEDVREIVHMLIKKRG